MNNKTKSKKMNVPHGLLTEVANRVKTSAQSVGATLGVYENTTIGVSDEKRRVIKEVAIEVAMEKVIEYGEFIDTVRQS